MKERKAKIWLAIAFCTCKTEVSVACARGVYSHSYHLSLSDLWCLSSYSLIPWPEENTRLLSSSLSLVLRPHPAFCCFFGLQAWENWAGPGNKATVVLQDYLSSCTYSMPCSYFCPGLTQSVLFFALLVSAERHTLSHWILLFFFSSIVNGVLCGSVTLRTKWLHIKHPCSFTLRTQ